VETTTHKTSLKEYSEAVQSLLSRDCERPGDALLRAHNAHVKALKESGFPDPGAVCQSGKALLLITKTF
jgi:hypothetical protein